MPWLSVLAELWFIAPSNPEDMMDWPADLTLQMRKYISLRNQMANPEEE